MGSWSAGWEAKRDSLAARRAILAVRQDCAVCQKSDWLEDEESSAGSSACLELEGWIESSATVVAAAGMDEVGRMSLERGRL